MAIWYVWNAAAGDDSGQPDWDNAAPSIDSVMDKALAAGDIILVASDHQVEYGASTTISLPVNCFVVSVNRTTNQYESMVTGGGYERATGASYNLVLGATATGHKVLTFSGIYFRADNTLSLAAEDLSYIRCFDCKFETGSSGGATFKLTGYDYFFVDCVNCARVLGNSSGAAAFWVGGGSKLTWRGGTITTADTSNRVVTLGNFEGGTKISISDVDMSDFSVLMLGLNNADGAVGDYEFTRCRLRSGVTVFTSPSYQDRLTCNYCSSAEITATPLPLYSHVAFAGTVSSTSAVYRIGGASDGENRYSYAMVGNTNANRLMSVDLPHPLTIWHDATNSKRLTIYLGSNDANLRDDEFWVEVSWNDESVTTYTTGTFLCTRAYYGLSEPANVSAYLKSDTSSWRGAGPHTKYKIVIPGINPQEPGPVVVRCYLAEQKTVWVCPKMLLENE